MENENQNLLVQAEEILTVTQLIFRIINCLENEFVHFWIKGEVSNLILAQSGHYYFNLKDENAQIKCVFFKYAASKQGFNKIKAGDEIEITGEITVYKDRGDLQIVVSQFKKLGLGKFYEKFEKLKLKLGQEGLFDAQHKKKIPPYPKAVGIITSRSGLVIKDVLEHLNHNIPLVIFYPTSVQGKGSENNIVAALNTASQRDEVDVVILCRGGGSIEDLWSFNEEITVRAVYECKIPIVTGIGHEPDWTLVDFVADKRESTPTAAANFVSVRWEKLEDQIKQKEDIIHKLFKHRYQQLSQKLDYLSDLILDIDTFLKVKKDKLRNFHDSIQNYFQHRLLSFNTKLNNFANVLEKYSINTKELYFKLDQQVFYLNNNFKEYLFQKHNEVDHLGQILEKNKPDISNYIMKTEHFNQNLDHYMHNYCKYLHEKIAHYKEILIVISPQNILERGFSIVKQSKTSPSVIKKADDLMNHQKIYIQFAEGEIYAVVDKPDINQLQLFDQ